jgi:hypothetical protein
MTSTALVTQEEPHGKDKATGRFVPGNSFGGKGGRPVGSKPRLSEAFISKLAKHFAEIWR